MLHFWALARPFIEKNFGLFLLIAFVIGLFIPGLRDVPKEIIPVLLASIIFLSCSKIHIADFQSFRFRDVIGIVLVRFLVLPFAFYGAALLLFPEYRYALLMLGLLPCGATLAAIMGIMGGSAALGLSATTITSILVPFSIPLSFMLLSDVAIEIDVWGMFKTLVLMIFVPVGVYFGFVRRFEPIKLVMRANASALSCLLICCGIIIVVAYQQDKFFEEPIFVLKTLAIGMVAYVIFYVLGWFFFPKANGREKLSYALMCGNNNINLGISLAVLFMPAFESLVMVMWELSWIAGLSVFQMFMRKRSVRIEML